MSLRVGVEMDPVSILLLECWCFYVCVYVSVRERRGKRCLDAQECVSLVAGKLEVISETSENLWNGRAG